MLKNFALMTLAAFALTGCNGSSSESSGKPDIKPPEVRFDYPIIDSQFSPNSAAEFHYSQMVNGVTQDDLSVRFEKHSGDSLLQLILDQDEDNSPLSNLLNSLINSGNNTFFRTTNSDGPKDGQSIFYVGNDGYLREIIDFYIDLSADSSNPSNDKLARALMLQYSKTIQTDGNKISGWSDTTNSSTLSFSVPLLKTLLADFADVPELSNLDDESSCKLILQQKRVETSERKTITIANKRIEAAPITNTDTYTLNCAEKELPKFVRSTALWYNPTFGILEQTEKLAVDGKPLSTNTIWLDSLPL